MNFRSLLLSGVLLMAMPTAASAACTTSDLAGKWWFTQLLDVHDEETGDSLFSFVAACRLTIYGNGEIITASLCGSGDFRTTFKEALEGLRLRLDRSCHIDQCTTVGCLVGQMSKDKIMLTGGVFDGLSRGTFGMVKQ
jgi:hypothetical protein